MRFINTTTFRIKSFDPDRHPYAILSHRWGDNEATFQEYQEYEKGNRAESDLGGFNTKIRGLCRQAKQDGLDWAWIDTCCVDKTSSSELSESINSMYAWYLKSTVCYVYLEDVERAACICAVTE
ncbi:heterokaryon incompatibility protein-domain-containing protein [Cladorrhinum sp. PSN332]|nr:heterokaryon incompatibility protein-domain-containing protein [Cladorrhinum sp. PSN332]